MQISSRPTPTTKESAKAIPNLKIEVFMSGAAVTILWVNLFAVISVMINFTPKIERQDERSVLYYCYLFSKCSIDDFTSDRPGKAINGATFCLQVTAVPRKLTPFEILLDLTIVPVILVSVIWMIQTHLAPALISLYL